MLRLASPISSAFSAFVLLTFFVHGGQSIEAY